MKKLIILLWILLFAVPGLFAQGNDAAYVSGGGSRSPVASLPVIYLSRDANVHFLSPEPIAYADVPGSLAGDLPVKNVLRLKLRPDSSHHVASGAALGVLSIAGESFIAQYQLVYSADAARVSAEVDIGAAECRPLNISSVGLTTTQIKSLALRILVLPDHRPIRQATAFGVTVQVNHIYTAGDLVFLDIGFLNDSNLPYDPDELRFKIEDKKITKASNVQSLELTPVWQLYPLTTFSRRSHHIFVLKKATFPDHKVLHIELSEKQVSGRTVTLQLKYGDLLKADHF